VKKLLAVVLALVLTLSISVPVLADGSDIPTGAEMTGGGLAPTIKAKWELDDDDCVTAGCQLIVPAGQWDPATGVQTLGTVPVTTWTVVTDEEGIADIMTVYNEVWEPDPTLGPCEDVVLVEKWQEIMIELPMEAGPPVTIPAVGMDAIEAAVASEQITQACADDLIAELTKKEARMYYWTGEIDTHQASGCYTSKVYATDTGGATSAVTSNTFEVYSTLAFAIDFDVLNWGPIKPNITKTISGNDVMEVMLGAAGTNDNPPTIKNLGNDPLSLKVTFDEMVGSSFGKKITSFDCVFMGIPIDPMAAGTEYSWTELAYLERCHEYQIDFSIHPDSTIVADTYSGMANISITSYTCPP
jgi:hypothetical protein